MKKDKSATNPPAPNKSETPKFPTVSALDSFFRYPLELHASIASRLLEGDDFEKAADRAFRLLLACNERLLKDRFETQQLINKGEVIAEMLHHPGLMVASIVHSDDERTPFDVAIKTITGQERPERAESDYRLYFNALHPGDAATVEYEQEKQQGIPTNLLLWHRHQYLSNLESTGFGGKRRRNKKIH